MTLVNELIAAESNGGTRSLKALSERGCAKNQFTWPRRPYEFLYSAR